MGDIVDLPEGFGLIDGEEHPDNVVARVNFALGVEAGRKEAAAEILSLRQQIEANGVHADAPRERSAIDTPRDSAAVDGSELQRLLLAIKRIVDSHAEIKEGSRLLYIYMAPHTLKELRSAFEPFRNFAPTSTRSVAETPCVEGVTPESIRQQIEIARVEERGAKELYREALDNIWTQGVEGPTDGWMMIPRVEWDSIFNSVVAIRARNGSSSSPVVKSETSK